MAEKSVLIIEDDADTRFMCSAILSGEGYKMVEAKHATDAIQILENEADLKEVSARVGAPDRKSQNIGHFVRFKFYVLITH